MKLTIELHVHGDGAAVQGEADLTPGIDPADLLNIEMKLNELLGHMGLRVHFWARQVQEERADQVRHDRHAGLFEVEGAGEAMKAKRRGFLIYENVAYAPEHWAPVGEPGDHYDYWMVEETTRFRALSDAARRWIDRNPVTM